MTPLKMMPSKTMMKMPPMRMMLLSISRTMRATLEKKGKNSNYQVP